MTTSLAWKALDGTVQPCEAVPDAAEPGACAESPAEFSPPEQIGAATTAGSSQSLAAIQADRSLVERCLAGEVAAWEELYGRFHELLCASVRSLLGPRGRDPNLTDEIVARVWYALVEKDGQLLNRFDAGRHVQLRTYLRGLARIHTLLYFRGEHRRRKHEAHAGRKQRHNLPKSELPAGLLLSDFADTLTADERRFLKEHLASPNGESVGTDERESAGAKFWQRRSRIMAKFRAFFASR